MSIAPPSDIVLDVAQAADPTRLEAATARLARIAAGGTAGSDDFATALTAVRKAAAPIASQSAVPTIPDDRSRQVVTRPTSPYEKFEAMVLQNFVETMLPKDTELFGDSASADPMRSMLAGQLASQIAKTGQVGIAHAIERARGAATAGVPKPTAAASLSKLQTAAVL